MGVLLLLLLILLDAYIIGVGGMGGALFYLCPGGRTAQLAHALQPLGKLQILPWMLGDPPLPWAPISMGAM